MYENTAKSAGYQHDVYGKAHIGGLPECAVPEQSELEGISARLDELINFTAVQRDNAARLSSRLLGESPPNPATTAGQIRPCRSGLSGQIQDKLDEAFSNMRDTDEALSRLRRGI